MYGARPPAAGAFRTDEVQAEADALPGRVAAEDHVGPVEVESYTVMHDRDGQPERGLLALLTADGDRTWGSSDDPATMAELLTTSAVGRAGDLAPDGTLTLT